MPGPADRHPLDDSPRLVERTWPTVGTPLVLVPVGSTEQHGPHLPLDTDTAIGTAVSERLAERLRGAGEDAVVAPPIAYGSSGEHQDFPGTMSIGTAALEIVLVELGRSACVWAPRLVFVNGHGGNLEALVRAVRLLRSEARDVAWLPCAAEDGATHDAHAGRDESSLIGHLRAGSLRGDRLEPGATSPIAELLPRLRAGGVRSVSPNGVLGDPRPASADEGRRLLEAMVDAAWRRLHGTVDADGRLTAPRNPAAGGAAHDAEHSDG